MTRQLSAVIGLSVLVGIGAGIEVTGTGCQNPAVTVSDGELRNATANGAAVELKGLGYRLRHRPSCRTPAGNTRRTVRVHCEAVTTDGRPVRVEGVAYDAESRHPRQHFVIRVAGRVVLRKSCLGLGCRDRS
ncbi:hypothetical protein ACRYCC_09695 [Actinomadura scrupuli]|uniref:hypothetical protein n=1 Tax=Actinomadura scrupuli TaxID=559629 RepID=UPI003D9760B6